MTSTARGTVLEAQGVTVGYGELPVLRNLDLRVDAGEVVALLGPNGAGKTTTLLTLAGELTPDAGTIEWLGSVTTAPMHKRCRHGLAFVTEERSVFMEMSARENLRMGRCDPDAAIDHFPELAEHLDRKAGLLSGGQQQIVTVARALARKPKALLADELSLGLAPMVVDRLLAAIRSAADAGLGVLLVEQHIRKALKVADRVYVLRRGQVVFEGTGDEARRDVAAIEAAYLAGVR